MKRLPQFSDPKDGCLIEVPLYCSVFQYLVLQCSSPRLQTTLCHGRVLQKHRQQRFVCLLCFAASCTCCITLVLLRWLAVSVHQEMALMSWGLLNNADFFSCYVIKRLVMLRTKMQQLNPGAPELDCSLLLNLFPATSFFWRTLPCCYYRYCIQCIHNKNSF